MSHDVFISHSSRDKPVADGLCAALEGAGIRCWIAPRDLIPGRAFSGEIMRGIKSCRVMVLLFSSHANASPEVLREVQLATTNRLHLVNFRIEESGVSDDLAYFLGIPHWLDALSQPMREHHAKLVDSVKSLLALGPEEAPAPRPLPAVTTGEGKKLNWKPLVAAALLAIVTVGMWLWNRPKGDLTRKPTPANPPGSVAASDSEIIAQPKTPEDHYRNARVHDLKANISDARKEYALYLAADLDMLDPWINFSGMLKMQEGREGAVDTMRTAAGKSKTVAAQVAAALLEEREARLAKLLALEKEHPEYGPLPYFISQEFSETKRGSTTLAEKRSERDWLEKFRAAQAAGKVVKYFLDKKEAQTVQSIAETRWAAVSSTPAEVLLNPVSFTAFSANGTWNVTLMLSDYKAKELFYRMDGLGEFQSTGHQPIKNPETGLPLIKPSVALGKVGAGEHTIEVKYTDVKGQENGPYTFKFDVNAENVKQARQMLEASKGSWLYFAENEGKVSLFFLRLLVQGPGLREIHYSLNNDTVDQKFEFVPSESFGEPGAKMAVLVPGSTTFACVQVTYKDGTKSEVQRYERGK